MNKEKILEISKSLKFNIDEKIAIEIENEWKEVEKKFLKLKKIDTQNVLPMTRIDENPISFLREDIPKKGLKKEDILKNAPRSNKDFIFINKEGSND